MKPPDPALWQQRIAPLVRAVLMRKSGATLAADDTRADNVDAIELMQEVLARVWERSTDGGVGDIADLEAYAATVAHNAWSDHLRRRHPRRASLKNRLRYALEHLDGWAAWPGDDGDLLAGRRAWILQPAARAPANRLAALRDKRLSLPRGQVAPRAFEHWEGADWQRLFEALFTTLAGAAPLDELVRITARLVGLQEDRTESLDALGEAAHELPDTRAPRPDEAAETSNLLRRLWAAVLGLKPDYRRAYLLNLPGPGKLRADLEVFVLHGIASVADIGSSLALTEAQFRTAFARLGLDDGERFEVERCADDIDRFCLLWRHLPLADALIGELIGLEPQQVINRRMLALRELARVLGHATRSAGRR